MSTRADLTNLWQPFLATRGFVVLDGGLATELERRGARLDDPLWSAKLLLERPELIREVHEDYFRAGADVGTSASYQATIPGLVRHGLSHQQATDLLRRSVRWSTKHANECGVKSQRRAGKGPWSRRRSAAMARTWPTARSFVATTISASRSLIDWHRPRVEVLADSGADVLAFETVPCQREAEAIVRLLEEFPTTPAWLSFSCRDERHLCHGETLLDALQVAASAINVIAAGVNCTAPRRRRRPARIGGRYRRAVARLSQQRRDVECEHSKLDRRQRFTRLDPRRSIVAYGGGEIDRRVLPDDAGGDSKHRGLRLALASKRP